MQKFNNELMEIFEKAKKYDEISFIYNDNTLHCSFCGKRQEDVRKLVASAKAYICDECIRLCNEILEEELNEKEEVK